MNVTPATERTDESGETERAWRRFLAPRHAADYYGAWLELLCRTIATARAAVILSLDTKTGGFAPLAIWPELTTDVSSLREAAEAALKARSGVTLRPGDGTADALHIAYPLVVGDEVTGIVVLALGPLSGPRLLAARRALDWGVGWLEAQAWQQRAEAGGRQVERAAVALDLLAVVEEQPRLRAATTGLANAVAGRFGLARAAVGLLPRRRGGGVALYGLSATAHLPRNAPVARALRNAMDETVDQGAMVALPVPEDARSQITVAHRALKDIERAGAVASFPFIDRNVVVGALTVVTREGTTLSDEELRVGEAVAAVVGPLLALKARQQRLVSGRIVEWIGDGLALLLGRRRPTLKLAAAALITALAFVLLFEADFRVSADAVIEGEVQRAAVAPFAGFIFDAGHRAGDIVRAGEVLASLDDRDLKLDELRWQSEAVQLEQQRRQAQAKGDRAETALIEAQIRQAEAQVRLATEKRLRTAIVAPLDGVVLSGDLSQRLGAPVEQGETLFTIAPLDAYRVVMSVSETDLHLLAVGQRGQLLLAGVSTADFPLTVTAITPVASVLDGANVFRVEARLDAADPVIRPGMEGVGKVVIDRRPLASIWTRQFIDWLRFTLWSWIP